MNTSIEYLEMLARCLEAGEIPRTIQQWLQDCINRWRSGESLPDAFGITDSVAERIIRRDRALADYAKLLDGGVWAKSETIATVVKRNHMAMKKNPAIAAIEAIYPLPRTTRGIYNLLKNNTI